MVPPSCSKCGGRVRVRSTIRRGKWTLRRYCIPCTRSRIQRYKDQDLYRKAKVRWRSNNPEKRAAHRAVEYALKTGRLQRGPCETCGSVKNIQAHHDDYSKPLEVRWFCPKDHAQYEALHE